MRYQAALRSDGGVRNREGRTGTIVSEPTTERAALARPRLELLPEVRGRLLELREELVALREALREAAD